MFKKKCNECGEWDEKVIEVLKQVKNGDWLHAGYICFDCDDKILLEDEIESLPVF